MPCHGERNGKAKLTDAQVKAIRADYRPYVFGCRKVAKKHGLPLSTATYICLQYRRALPQ